jgi:hypothetical protein
LDTPAVTARALARRWLLGELDGDVVVPIAVACSALGLDAAALAAVRSQGDAGGAGQARQGQVEQERPNEGRDRPTCRDRAAWSV